MFQVISDLPNFYNPVNVILEMMTIAQHESLTAFRISKKLLIHRNI